MTSIQPYALFDNASFSDRVDTRISPLSYTVSVKMCHQRFKKLEVGGGKAFGPLILLRLNS
jgi:hypothetical protein